MAVENQFCQVQPQPAAAGIAAARRLGPEKRFKQVGQGVLADVRPGVDDGKHGPFLPHFQKDRHLRPLRRIEGGVGKQRPERAGEHGRVAAQGEAVRHLRVQFEAAQGKQLRILRKLPLRQLRKADGLRRRGRALQAGNGQQFANQFFHARGGLQGAGKVLVAVAVYAHAVQHAANLPLEDGHGGFQFVRRGGEESQPLLFPRPLALHFAAQGAVGLRKLAQGGGKPLGQALQAAAQRADFIPPPQRAAPAKIQFRHFSGDGAQAHDGPGHQACENQRAHQRKAQQRQQNPRRHFRKRAHGDVFRAQVGRDIERVYIVAVGKAHRGGGHVRRGHGNGGLRSVLRLAIGYDGHAVPGNGAQGQQRGRFHDFPPLVFQRHLHAGGADERIQRRAAVREIRFGQLLDKRVQLLLKVVVDHRRVGHGRRPGNQAEQHAPDRQQQQKGDCEYPRAQTFRDLPSRHGSPPPERFRCSPRPACGAGF